MANDIPTYDAAYGAGFASSLAYITNTEPASYQTSQAAATAFATQVDAAVFAAGGAGGNSNRANLMQVICAAVLSGRYLPNLGEASDDAISYEAIANAIAAAYINAKAGLL